MLASEINETIQELINLESSGYTYDALEASKVLLSVSIINLKERKPAKDSTVAKMVSKFSLKELIAQSEFLEKRLTNQEKFSIINKLWYSTKKRKGSVVNPLFYTQVPL